MWGKTSAERVCIQNKQCTGEKVPDSSYVRNSCPKLLFRINLPLNELCFSKQQTEIHLNFIIILRRYVISIDVFRESWSNRLTFAAYFFFNASDYILNVNSWQRIIKILSYTQLSYINISLHY